MSAVVARRQAPEKVRKLPLGQRIRWARKSAGLSHDRLVERLGRSNRGHLIKIERGDHIPRIDLRNAIADATNVPREMFASDDDEEDDPAMARQLLELVRAIARDELSAVRT